MSYQPRWEPVQGATKDPVTGYAPGFISIPAFGKQDGSKTVLCLANDTALPFSAPPAAEPSDQQPQGRKYKPGDPVRAMKVVPPESSATGEEDTDHRKKKKRESEKKLKRKLGREQVSNMQFWIPAEEVPPGAIVYSEEQCPTYCGPPLTLKTASTRPDLCKVVNTTSTSGKSTKGKSINRLYSALTKEQVEEKRRSFTLPLADGSPAPACPYTKEPALFFYMKRRLSLLPYNEKDQTWESFEQWIALPMEDGYMKFHWNMTEFKHKDEQGREAYGTDSKKEFYQEWSKRINPKKPISKSNANPLPHTAVYSRDKDGNHFEVPVDRKIPWMYRCANLPGGSESSSDNNEDDAADTNAEDDDVQEPPKAKARTGDNDGMDVERLKNSIDNMPTLDEDSD